MLIINKIHRYSETAVNDAALHHVIYIWWSVFQTLTAARWCWLKHTFRGRILFQRANSCKSDPQWSCWLMQFHSVPVANGMEQQQSFLSKNPKKAECSERCAIKAEIRTIILANYENAAIRTDWPQESLLRCLQPNGVKGAALATAEDILMWGHVGSVGNTGHNTNTCHWWLKRTKQWVRIMSTQNLLISSCLKEQPRPVSLLSATWSCITKPSVPQNTHESLYSLWILEKNRKKSTKWVPAVHS